VAPEVSNVAFKEGTLTFRHRRVERTSTFAVHILLKVDGDR